MIIVLLVQKDFKVETFLKMKLFNTMQYFSIFLFLIPSANFMPVYFIQKYNHSLHLDHLQLKTFIPLKDHKTQLLSFLFLN